MEEERRIKIKFTTILEYLFYIAGLVLILVGIDFYNEDLEYSWNVFKFDEVKYVGGDAYNFIISAARSSAVMIKSLIWIVLGCTSILIGRSFGLKK